MRPCDPIDVSRCGATELILGGDWALAHNNPATVARVARQLAMRVRAKERSELVEAAQRLERDADGGAALWYAATAGLRRRCRAPGPRRDDT